MSELGGRLEFFVNVGVVKLVLVMVAVFEGLALLFIAAVPTAAVVVASVVAVAIAVISVVILIVPTPVALSSLLVDWLLLFFPIAFGPGSPSDAVLFGLSLLIRVGGNRISSPGVSRFVVLHPVDVESVVATAGGCLLFLFLFSFLSTRIVIAVAGGASKGPRRIAAHAAINLFVCLFVCLFVDTLSLDSNQ